MELRLAWCECIKMLFSPFFVWVSGRLLPGYFLSFQIDCKGKEVWDYCKTRRVLLHLCNQFEKTEMKRYLLLFAALCMVMAGHAQKKNFSYKFYGQVRGDLFYNSRAKFLSLG